MSDQLPSLLSSDTTIRFQDCDPYGHLWNAKHIDYFLYAREDQVRDAYDLDIYEIGQTHGIGWVVASNQIAYLKPAHMLEKVTITSKIIDLGARAMTVEFQMINRDKGHLISMLWSRFAHFDLKTRKSIPHGDEMMERFKTVVNPVPAASFEERVKQLRSNGV